MLHVSTKNIFLISVATVSLLAYILVDSRNDIASTIRNLLAKLVFDCVEEL